MPETSGSGIISEDENYFEITKTAITADKARLFVEEKMLALMFLIDFINQNTNICPH